MTAKGGSTYILTNKNLTTLYTGSTIDIFDRYDQHLKHFFPNAFSSRYNLYKLVFIIHFSTIQEARRCEYYIKGKKRSWKIELIERGNPLWMNLYPILNSEAIEDYFIKYDELILG